MSKKESKQTTARSAAKTVAAVNWKASTKFVGWVLLVCAAIGLLASFTLLHETFEVAKNPAYVPSCNINPFLSCTSSMASPESKLVFGIPNPAFGIAAFTALFVFSVLVLAGTQFKRWVWAAGIGAAAGGVLFSAFLYFTSLFALGTICPWCFTTWVITIGAFWAITTYSLSSGVLALGADGQKFAEFWARYATVILVATYILLVFGILIRFREALFV